MKSSCVAVAIAFAFSTYILTGCKGSEETSQQETKKETLNDFLARYEKTFNPAQYEIELAKAKREAVQESTGTHSPLISDSTLVETIAGFRVQVLSTESIDEATQLRDSLTALLQDQWTYVEYDAPYYKVRVGNFLDRFSADTFVNVLIQKDFQSAWVVPDQVLKHPPLKPQILPQPQHQHER